MKLTFYSPARRPSNEEKRQDTVDRLRAQGIARPDALRAVIEETAALLDCPTAALTILDGDRQLFIDPIGTPIQSTSRAASFCAHAILEPDHVFCVPDARLDRRFAGNPLVIAQDGVCFYVGAPVAVGDAMIGALCAVDGKPHAPLDEGKRARLRELAVEASRAVTGD